MALLLAALLRLGYKSVRVLSINLYILKKGELFNVNSSKKFKILENPRIPINAPTTKTTISTIWKL